MMQVEESKEQHRPKQIYSDSLIRKRDNLNPDYRADDKYGKNDLSRIPD